MKWIVRTYSMFSSEVYTFTSKMGLGCFISLCSMLGIKYEIIEKRGVLDDK